MLKDAFSHHVWASVRLLDACIPLSPEQLAASVPGTYGSILETARHLVGSDSWYLFRITGDRGYVIDEEHMDVRELRAEMDGHDAEWSRLLGQDLDPGTILVGRNDDGSETHVPTSLRFAQVLHHGTDHRSQICTALTTLGLEPPDIDVWAFGEQDGRVVEVPAPS
jgi:uncharacterized damage-inducible protein DinB